MEHMKDPHVGSWKLNEAKSKFTPGTVKFTTIVYESVAANMKVTTHGIEANGKTAHSEWSGKFDGKDYPVTGRPNQDTRSCVKVNDRTLEFTARKNGKVTVTGLSLVSADGTSCSVTATGITPEGKEFKHVTVYDKMP